MAVSRPRVMVGFKDLEARREGALDRELATSVVLDLVFGRSGDFYSRTYERGVIDDSFSFSYNCDDPYGFSLVGGETDTPEALADQVRAELRKARRRKFKKRDVERAKRKRIGRYLRSFDGPDGLAFLLLGCVPRGIDVFSIPEAISRLTPKILQDRLEEHFVEKNSAVSIITPKGKVGFRPERSR